MKRWFFFLIIAAFLFISGSVDAQYAKDGYQFESKIKAPRVRRPIAHELLLDPNERFIVVSYSSKPTVVVLYEIGTWKEMGSYNIPGWFDLSNSFVGPNGKFLFLDFARYSSKYRRIDLESQVVDTVECYDTPRGCVPKEGGVPQKELYTKDKTYYFSINKKNRRDILIFKRREE
jgi:hypothetical protein